jgi:hypothetical protein
MQAPSVIEQQYDQDERHKKPEQDIFHLEFVSERQIGIQENNSQNGYQGFIERTIPIQSIIRIHLLKMSKKQVQLVTPF